MGKQALSREPVPLADIVHEVLAELSGECEGRRVEVEVGKLPTVHADRVLVKQALVNLLGNALKFTKERDPARIEVGSFVEGGLPVVFVRDNGAGFDMRYADKLFGVFQRLHATTEFEGSGIGLALVRRIVARHGGRIWAEAAVGEGAAFYFTLGGERVA